MGLASDERFAEEIVQRYWPPEEIERRIEAAELQVIRRAACNPFALGAAGDLK